ncbi:hypothetical protein PSEUDO8Z_60485 [Pseudomonas sp. 8Z]|nr:hypothetical protein PSEUDO8Z_60485 [Pseudomonas sp. 8Z]
MRRGLRRFDLYQPVLAVLLTIRIMARPI